MDAPNPTPKNESNPGAQGDITQFLEQAGAGSEVAREKLLHAVYNELRVIAGSHLRNERPNHTLGATALVNESYLKLIGSVGGNLQHGTNNEINQDDPSSFVFTHRHAFYKAAAIAMRRILIDHARSKAAIKRSAPSGFQRISIDILEASTQANPEDLLSLDEALSRLENEDDRAASIVRLRFFAGRSIDEIALMLGVSSRTVKRDWEFARARLQQLIENKSNDHASE